jgi:hypothetical protein
MITESPTRNSVWPILPSGASALARLRIEGRGHEADEGCGVFDHQVGR